MTPEETLASIENLLVKVTSERVGSQTWLFDDALQEARIRAWQRLDEGHPKGIAVYAARQAVIDVVRQRRATGSKRGGGVVDTHTKSTSIFKQGDDGEGFIYEPPAEDDSHERIELGDVLRRAMEALSPHERALVEAYYLVGFDQGEIAEAQGVTRQAISARLRKALTTMRARLAETSGDSLAHVGAIAS